MNERRVPFFRRAAPKFQAAGSLSVLLLLLAAKATHGKGVEGAQLDYVPLDQSVECNRILFQSSQHFKRTLFVIPRVVQGQGVEATRNYSIRPSSKEGHYVLSVNLYFPRNDEVLKASGASSYKKDLSACNWDKVKNAINQNIPEPANWITTISRIPLTSIEVQIPGIEAVAVIGKSMATSDESDILDYYGRSLRADFVISEKEKETFQSQLVSPQGIAASVRFRFKARRRESAVRAKIDIQNVSAQFNAAIASKGLKFLTAAELQTTLRAAFSNNSVQITSEGGNSEDTTKVVHQLIEKIMKDVSFAAPSTAGEGKEAKAPELKASSTDSSGGALFSASAVAQVLKSGLNSEFEYNVVAAPEAASAQTEVRLYADKLNDPNVAEFTLSAGYLDPSSGVTLSKGMSVVITPVSWKMEKIIYKDNRRYLTSSEIQELNLGHHFPDLLSDRMKVKDRNINGTLLAEGSWQPLPFLPIPWPYKYRWARISKEAVRYQEISDLIRPGLESLNQLPIFVSFSEMGASSLFSLGDLAKSDLPARLDAKGNPYWESTYDAKRGRLTITALQDLGMIRFRQRMRDSESVQYAASGKPLLMDEVLEQRVGLWGGSKYLHRATLATDDRAILRQKSIILQITKPQKARPATSPEESRESSDGPAEPESTPTGATDN